MNRIWKLSIIITALIILDQLTKGVVQQNFALGESVPVIKGFFNFTYVQNQGAAFGMGAQSGDFIRLVLFKILPVFACFWLMWEMWKYRYVKDKALLSYAYGLVLAGAIGNLIDRISLDYVVDFLDFHYKQHHFPAFNVADSAISVAFVLLVIEMIIDSKKQKNLEANTNTVE